MENRAKHKTSAKHSLPVALHKNARYVPDSEMSATIQQISVPCSPEDMDPHNIHQQRNHYFFHLIKSETLIITEMSKGQFESN